MSHVLRSVHPVELPSAEQPTYEEFLKHLEKHGWGEPTRNDGHGNPKPKNLKAYAYLAAVPFIETCFDYLGENQYVEIIEAVGYRNFTEQARADWRESRGLEVAAA